MTAKTHSDQNNLTMLYALTMAVCLMILLMVIAVVIYFDWQGVSIEQSTTIPYTSNSVITGNEPVQLGAIWIPADPDFMLETVPYNNDNVSQSVQIGYITVP